jgi:NAD(P)-dependent dehydrogenase (short-subunit alcohol dehydrogenase family)
MSSVALITGCRSGFGLLTAAAAGRAGWTVYAGLRALEHGDALREATAGLDVRPIVLDVTSAEQRESAIAQIIRETGRLDALVNNAGQALGGFLELVEEDELRAIFETNLFGAWALTRLALPHLRAHTPSTVVMVSSASGRMAIPGLGAYAASKFALEGLSEAWRHELALFGVRVVLIEPGAYRTDIFGRNRHISRGVNEPGVYAPWVAGMDKVFASFVDRVARDPAEVAEVIVRVLSDPRPPLRTPIGPSTGVRAALRALIPERVTEAVIGRLLRHAREQGERLLAQKP